MATKTNGSDRWKEGTRVSYRLPSGTRDTGKIVGYIEHSNGLFARIKKKDGSEARARFPSMVTRTK